MPEQIHIGFRAEMGLRMHLVGGNRKHSRHQMKMWIAAPGAVE